MQDISELHQAALNYAANSIAVFPCVPQAKKPATENGFKDATCDIDQINKWWTENPKYNIGFNPAMANLTVVDLDPGYKLKETLPLTYSVKTPRGLHLYYEGITKSSASKIGEHVDTRSEGGYVLAAPSVVDNKTYTVQENIDYAPLPEWIIETLRKPEITYQAEVHDLDLEINVQRAKDVIKNLEPAIQGQGGDEKTYEVCCRIRDFGLSELKALEVLEPWNETCSPPWSIEELQQKILNAYAYAQNEPGVWAIESPQKVFGEVISKIYPKSRFYFKDEGEQENEPDPKWIVKDLISERSTVLLYGPTQSYKSFLMLDIALGISCGQETFGDTPSPGIVLYAALEGRAHLKKARRSWKLAKQIDKINNFYIGLAPMIGVNGEVQEFGDEIFKRCNGQKPKLIIIDTLGKAMAGLNENDAQDAGKFIRFCDSLVEQFDCSVLAIHHTGKDQTKGARGSSAFHAGFDTVIEVAAKRSSKAVSVWVKKHKDAEEREQPWTFEGRNIGGSLVFFSTTPQDHHILLNEDNEFSHQNIGKILKDLNAFGEDKGVATHIIALELAKKYKNYDEGTISKLTRVLTKEAKTSLSGLMENGKWCLLAPKD